jgi:hypothetical protein
MSFICDICNTKTSTRYNLGKHKQSENCQKVKREIEQLNKINELTEKNKEQEELINNFREINNDNNFKINNLENKVKTLEELYKKEKEISEQYRKIVEKAATKSTKTVNNNNNNTYNRNNYLNYISKEPIKFSELQQNISNLVTTKTIMFDNDDFNDHITKNILRDENGKDKILCTDINRKNFTYKDEKSGQLVSDPELERLREQLVKGTNNKSIKKDLLDKLIKKYEGTGVDPYNKFYEYLQNIQFGTPFVEHIAKKTYIKTKPDSIKHNEELNNLDNFDNFDDIDVENINDFDDIDKLYNQMKNEFE